MSKISISIRVDGNYHTAIVAGVDVPDFMQQAFEPLRVCDDVPLAAVCGEAMAGEEKERVVLKMREDAAELLSRKLTCLILDEMSKFDTSNGYSLRDN